MYIKITISILIAIALISCDKSIKDDISKKSETIYDSVIVDQLNKKSWKASSTNFEKAKSLADSALFISEQINYVSGIGKSYSRIALAFDYKGSYDTAFYYYDKAVEIFIKINNKEELAKAYNNIGASYYCRAKYIEATQYYIKSLNIREALNDKKGVAQSLNNIGLLYRIQKNYPKAIEFYKESISIRTTINDSIGILYAEQNLAVAFEKSEQYDSALHHYNNAILLSTELNDSISLGANLSNACILNKNIGNYELAIQQAEQSESIVRTTNEKHVLAYSIATYADLYLRTKQLNKALKYAKEGLEMSLDLDFPDLTQSYYQIISDAYAKQGEFNNAYTYHTLYSSIKDSILNIESSQQLKDVQTKYETVKKEKQIATLTQEKTIASQQKYLAYVIVALLLLLIGVIYLVHKQFKIKAEQNAISLEQSLLRSQMNPHFIFNSLNAINSFIISNKAAEAGLFLSRFAKLMRNILEGSRKELITLEQELEIIDHYLKLEQLRFCNQFNYRINVDPNIDSSDIDVPPMLLQPFIENTIKHAFTKCDSTESVTIDFTLKNDNLLIGKITDTGIGINAGKKSDHKSYGLAITRERLAHINRKLKTGIGLNITDLSERGLKGTEVVISIPV